MPSNQQEIPLGLIAIQPYLEFVVSNDPITSLIPPGDNVLSDDAFENPPSVFIDGLLLTYAIVADRRYISFNRQSKTITINNAPVNEGEIVQIFL
jgi:hypothetical protein